MTRESSKSNPESSQFYHYGPNTCRMMDNIAYDLTKRSSLNFGQGRRTLLRSYAPKQKASDYYHQTRRGLGYVSTPIPSGSKSKEPIYHDHSSGTLPWESDISVSTIFEDLLVNMVSTSHMKDEDENEEMI